MRRMFGWLLVLAVFALFPAVALADSSAASFLPSFLASSPLLMGAVAGAVGYVALPLLLKLAKAGLGYIPRFESSADRALLASPFAAKAPIIAAATAVVGHHVALAFVSLGKIAIADAQSEGKVDDALKTKVFADVLAYLKSTISLDTVKKAAAELGLVGRTDAELQTSFANYVSAHVGAMIAETQQAVDADAVPSPNAAAAPAAPARNVVASDVPEAAQPPLAAAPAPKV